MGQNRGVQSFPEKIILRVKGDTSSSSIGPAFIDFSLVVSGHYMNANYINGQKRCSTFIKMLLILVLDVIAAPPPEGQVAFTSFPRTASHALPPHDVLHVHNSGESERAPEHTHVALADDLCAPSPKPRIALMACGNMRTFGDPRVYKSLRHNVVDALGGNTSVFVWMRLGDDAYKVNEEEHARPGYQRLDYVHSLEKVRTAVSYIAKHGRNVEVIFEYVNGTSDDIFNDNCSIFDSLKTHKQAWLRKLFPSYIGQMHTHYMAFQMVEAYELQQGMKFDYVIKTRTDIVFLRSVMPFCAYLPNAVYTGRDSPSDWILLMPRAVAHEAMRAVWDRYRSCDDGTKFLKDSMADCCGGGPTGLVVGAVMRMRAPMVGPAYPKRMHQGPAINPPAGSVFLKHDAFHMAIMRDATENFFCKGVYLYSNTMEFFPNADACRRVLEPDFVRFQNATDQRGYTMQLHR